MNPTSWRVVLYTLDGLIVGMSLEVFNGSYWVCVAVEGDFASNNSNASMTLAERPSREAALEVARATCGNNGKLGAMLDKLEAFSTRSPDAIYDDSHLEIPE